MDAKPRARPRGPWTAEEIARNERVAQIRVQQDRARGVSANLEDAVRLTRFAHEFAGAFREVPPFDPIELLSHLHEHRVEHIIVGGLAISAHGYVHAVEHLDIVAEPSPENLERLASALSGANAIDADSGQADRAAASGASRCLATELGTVNVIGGIHGIEAESLYAELDPEAVSGMVEGTPVRVCGLDQLRALDGASGRTGDVAGLEQLGTD
jgi:hypothetical protein